MDFSGYMSTAFRDDVKGVELSRNELEFFVNTILCRELFYGPFSVYNIFTHLKKCGPPIAYKNVHQKVHKLVVLGLLRETREVFAERGAKYYKISVKGWMNLILNEVFYPHYMYELLIKHYYDRNLILVTFLTPFFELDTLMKLSEFDVITYLVNCCRFTFSWIQIWRHALRDGRFPPPFTETVCLLPRRDKHSPAYDRAYIQGKVNRKPDPAEISRSYSKSLNEDLGLFVTSFLFQQIMKYSDSRKMKAILSNDTKFVAAIQGMGKEFQSKCNKISSTCMF